MIQSEIPRRIGIGRSNIEDDEEEEEEEDQRTDEMIISLLILSFVSFVLFVDVNLPDRSC